MTEPWLTTALTDAVRRDAELARNLQVLRRRGLSRRVVRDLADREAAGAAREIMAMTQPPAREPNAVRRVAAWLWVALSGADPDGVWRARVAANIARLNAAADEYARKDARP